MRSKQRVLCELPIPTISNPDGLQRVMIELITRISPLYPTFLTRDNKLWLIQLVSLEFLKCGQPSHWLLRGFTVIALSVKTNPYSKRTLA